jgi:hypothetical protein
MGIMITAIQEKAACFCHKKGSGEFNMISTG